MPVEYVNDSVHGRIELTEEEKAITQTPIFQRLGRLQQLGLASMLFPGGTNTRLAHSLGTLHVMSKIIRQLRGTGSIEISDQEERKLRLAALLHDIGQYPLSHVIESVYRRVPTEVFQDADAKRIQERFPYNALKAAASHMPQPYDQARDKAIGEQIIRKRQDLQEVLKRYHKTNHSLDKLPTDVAFPLPMQDRIEYNPEERRLVFKGLMTDSERDLLLDSSTDSEYRRAIEVLFQTSATTFHDMIEDIIRIITGHHHLPLYKQLMDSDYDCDRLDSINRDAYYTGVIYGFVDLNYLIENMRVVHDPPHTTIPYLAVNKRRALHTLEHYLTARYFMYTQIIHHRTIKSLEMLAKAIFLELARQGFVYRNFQEIYKIIPSDEYLFFDDSYFFQKIYQYYRNKKGDARVKDWILRVIHGRPLTVVAEIRKLPTDNEYMHYRTWCFNERNLDDLCRNAGISVDEVIPNEILVEFVPLVPVQDIYKKILIGATEEAAYLRESPRLYDEEKERQELLLLDTSSILCQLAQQRLSIVTIFCFDEEVKDKILNELKARRVQS